MGSRQSRSSGPRPGWEARKATRARLGRAGGLGPGGRPEIRFPCRAATCSLAGGCSDPSPSQAHRDGSACGCLSAWASESLPIMSSESRPSHVRVAPSSSYIRAASESSPMSSGESCHVLITGKSESHPNRIRVEYDYVRVASDSIRVTSEYRPSPSHV